MKWKQTCDSCNQDIVLDYDESQATPAFCPFCGADLAALEDGTFDDEPLVTEEDWGDAKFDSF